MNVALDLREILQSVVERSEIGAVSVVENENTGTGKYDFSPLRKQNSTPSKMKEKVHGKIRHRARICQGAENRVLRDRGDISSIVGHGGPDRRIIRRFES